VTVSRVGQAAGGRRSISDAGRRVPRAGGLSLARLGIGDDSRRIGGDAPVVFIAATQAIVGPPPASLSLPIPPGNVGDLLLLWLVCDFADFAVPAGYAETPGLLGVGNNGSRNRVATRTSTGSESTLVIAMPSTAGRFGGVMLRFRPGKSGPIDVFGKTTTNTTLPESPTVAPSVEASVAGHLVCLFHRQDGGTFTDPPGTTRRTFQNDLSLPEGANMSMLTVSQSLTAPGSTGTRTAGWSGFDTSDDSYAASIVLR
jgi:hypothetical protein